MGLFSAPTSFRLNSFSPTLAPRSTWDAAYGAGAFNGSMPSMMGYENIGALESTGGGHPSILNLVLLVFEAVLEVVCVAVPGYIIARMGMFTVEQQKFIANLNVSLFTPCLSEYLLATGMQTDHWR